jgi:hypothetical protein
MRHRPGARHEQASFLVETVHAGNTPVGRFFALRSASRKLQGGAGSLKSNYDLSVMAKWWLLDSENVSIY